MSLNLSYPPELPVSAARPEILDALRNHQVVVISGATGSGKTTQLPKMCLEIGRGTKGMIGHTQPRRLAARTVASRIATEIGEDLGKTVGYQVRFRQTVSQGTRVKLMTDGILLAEMGRDPLLRQYDTLIIDEAHERSLNIDFILGYLQRLVKRRPDLLVIITSATIDSTRFAKAFGESTPVIEVAGRTYPVEVRYRPYGEDEETSFESLGTESNTVDAVDNSVDKEDDQEADQVTGILRAVDELREEGTGDILVFLAGERDIRDTASALKGHLGKLYLEPGEGGNSKIPGAIEVLPLYSRLSEAEQHRVFASHARRRIVLATNVAETSLTVPGIVYVIDPGVARISRYSNKTRVQRLPIEPISQASANQRKGRCGRIAPGICIRLYSEEDFESRPEYTEPEIQRTSLSAVILQMAALGLGEVADFPFLDPPAPRSVTDGVQELSWLGALDARKKPARITRLGRKLARLPVDPRLGRILLAADELGVGSEAVIVVAALAMQDVRERPTEKRDQADAMHARFEDERSDFLSYLRLWSYLQERMDALGGSAFRRLCRREFLHYLRVREWIDLVGQLREMLRDIGIKTRELGAFKVDMVDEQSLHRAILTGMLSQIGYWSEQKREYQGVKGTRFVIWPGSGLVKKHYDWVMAGELVETSRLFARTVAKVEPEWIEKAGERLLTRTYYEPYWSTRHGAAMIHERVLLFGLVLVADRSHTLGSLGETVVERVPARELARDMFIRHALVGGEWRERYRFIETNRMRRAEAEEARVRLQIPGEIDDFAVERWFDTRIPESVTSTAAFNNWWKDKRHREPEWLDLPWDLLVPEGENSDDFPDYWTQGELTLPLAYTFGGKRGRVETQPNSSGEIPKSRNRRGHGKKAPREIDVVELPEGVTVIVPEELLETVSPSGFDWPVPGALRDNLLARVKALPKAVRKRIVPAGSLVEDIWPLVSGYLGESPEDRPPLKEVFANGIFQARQIEITPDDLAAMEDNLGEKQRNHFAVVGKNGKVLALGDDFEALRDRLIVDTTKENVKVWKQQEEELAKVEKPRDYAAALSAALELTETRVITRWRGAEAVALAASPYASTSELVAAAQQAAGVALVERWLGAGKKLEGDEDLEALQVEAKQDFEDTVYEILQSVARAMKKRGELETVLREAKQSPNCALQDTIEDIVSHVNQILGGDFLSRTPCRWLVRLEKYLATEMIRLEKARHNTAGDRDLARRLAEVQGRFDEVEAALAAKPFNATSSKTLEEARWLLEEFRVSLFAQQIGTAEKVSAKRLHKLLDQIS